MRKNFRAILIILLLLAGALYGQAKLRLFNKPCTQPVTYSLGSFDGKFGISKDKFLKDIEKSIKVWEDSTNLDLFKYDPNGKLKINLVYDYRQAATDKLQSLGVKIDDTQSSYESLKSRYNTMSADYSRLRQSLDAEVSDYNRQKQDYEQQVNYWNNQGVAPKNVVRSEEHTSELQSPDHLVCRLLLEKQKKKSRI